MPPSAWTRTATFSNGVATFNWSERQQRAGSGYTLKATASGPSPPASTPAFTVTAPGIATRARRDHPAVRLVPGGLPPFSLVVKAEDDFRNRRLLLPTELSP